jgi:hypothetical protein
MAEKVLRSEMRQSSGREVTRVTGSLGLSPVSMAAEGIGRPPLRGQALAPLGPASSQNGLPGSIGHAMAEAVPLGAAAVVGLIGALHEILLDCRTTVARQR